MGAIHQALGGTAAEYPGQLGDFRYIRLAVEQGLVGIQSQGQPGRGDFLAGLANLCRILALDQRVVISKEKEGVHRLVVGSGDGRADSAHVVAQVGCASGGYPGKYALLGHGIPLQCKRRQ